MPQYAIGYTDLSIEVKAEIKDIIHIVHGKCIEKIVEMDNNTLDIFLSSNKIIRIIRKNDQLSLYVLHHTSDENTLHSKQAISA